MKYLRVVFILLFLFLISACSSTLPLLITDTLEPASIENNKPINTPLSTLTITPAQTITPNEYKNFGVLLQHYQNEYIKYVWFSYVPKSVRFYRENEPVNILIVCANATMSDNYDDAISSMKDCIQGREEWAEKFSFVLLTPVIPRNSPIPIYAVAFDKRVFTEVDPFFQRPDLEVIKMIDKMKNDLDEGNIKANDKIFIEGFSAGGMFAQRFTLLHPEIVKAIAAGQCGGALTMPIEEFRNYKMDWPLGISDFKEITGESFNLDAYKEVSQYIYIGSNDNQNSTVGYGNEIWTNTQVNILNLFGKTDPNRLKNQVEYANSLGFEKIFFKLYPNYKHNYYDDQISDIFNFFAENK